MVDQKFPIHGTRKLDRCWDPSRVGDRRINRLVATPYTEFDGAGDGPAQLYVQT